MGIPNLLTLLRILLIPILVFFYYLPTQGAHLIAALIFALAACTDGLDGYLARHLRQGTHFGAFLDPVADKLIVAVALILVVGQLGGAYLAIPASIIIAREILISGLREWMTQTGGRTRLSVNRLGKIKTILQMLALCCLLLYDPGSHVFIKILGLILLYLAAMLTLWSMVIYLRIAWPDLVTATKNKQP